MSGTWDDWRRFVAWEHLVPERFDEARSTAGSDYNVESSIVEATADEVAVLFGGGQGEARPRL